MDIPIDTLSNAADKLIDQTGLLPTLSGTGI
jgi:hypothetical protein